MDVRIAQVVVIVAYLCWAAAANPTVVGKRPASTVYSTYNIYCVFTCESFKLRPCTVPKGSVMSIWYTPCSWTSHTMQPRPSERQGIKGCSMI